MIKPIISRLKINYCIFFEDALKLQCPFIFIKALFQEVLFFLFIDEYSIQIGNYCLHRNFQVEYMSLKGIEEIASIPDREVFLGMG